MSHSPIGYVYDADIYCADCTPVDMQANGATDSEGNEVGAVFSWSETGETGCDHCGSCLEPLYGDCQCPVRLTDLISAAGQLAYDYHSGQWSRGYRLGCLANRAWLRRYPLSRGVADRPLGAIAQRVYDAWVVQHGRSM